MPVNTLIPNGADLAGLPESDLKNQYLPVSGLGAQLADNRRVVVLTLTDRIIRQDVHDRIPKVSDHDRTYVLTPSAAAQLARELESAVQEYLGAEKE